MEATVSMTAFYRRSSTSAAVPRRCCAECVSLLRLSQRLVGVNLVVSLVNAQQSIPTVC
eukprot:COSAG02_NODE_8290_length_2631_cov_1.917457_3_plen_58_part_01